MNNIVKDYRFRKCYDVRTDFVFFEVLDDTDSILLDISKNDNGEFQILFYEDLSSKILSVNQIEDIIKEGKKLILDEET